MYASVNRRRKIADSRADLFISLFRSSAYFRMESVIEYIICGRAPQINENRIAIFISQAIFFVGRHFYCVVHTHTQYIYFRCVFVHVGIPNMSHPQTSKELGVFVVVCILALFLSRSYSISFWDKHFLRLFFGFGVDMLLFVSHSFLLVLVGRICSRVILDLKKTLNGRGKDIIVGHGRLLYHPVAYSQNQWVFVCILSSYTGSRSTLNKKNRFVR